MKTLAVSLILCAVLGGTAQANPICESLAKYAKVSATNRDHGIPLTTELRIVEMNTVNKAEARGLLTHVLVQVYAAPSLDGQSLQVATYEGCERGLKSGSILELPQQKNSR